ncbi:hypothetical protein ACIRD3_22885 [Kitasatospora sp. NPDC093550]|uniref:hypothetical protein n=1 Tax=Kitasatospora sp. NPDC093550 TaxID=3364089 RepID=UPI00381B185E
MVYTDFTKYSHAQLRTMAQALDPGAVMAAGDPWRTAADTLKRIRLTLTKASTEAATTWEGTTSDAFHTRMLNLAASINNAAAYANDAANILHSVSEAMAKAKREMPEEPGTWDKVKDNVGDGVSALFGDGDDEHIPIADRKKAEAATVMQTLAMHYRIATPALKAPPLTATGKVEKPADPGSQDDAGNVAAMVSAVVSGTSFGTGGAPARSTTAATPQRANASRPSVTAGSAGRQAAAPTDPGVKGGTAQAPPKPSTTTSRGPDAGISGTPVPRPSGSVPSPPTSGTQTSGLGGVPVTDPARGPISGGGGQTVVSPSGPTTQGPPGPPGFGGSGEMPVQGAGSRGGRAVAVGGEESHPALGAGRGGVSGAKQGGGAVAGPGGSVRQTPYDIGARGKQAFTEGGSGLGARGRLRGEPGGTGANGMSPGVPLSGAPGRKKDGEKGGKRPDYLVEDEETWASNKPANPNVVE